MTEEAGQNAEATDQDSMAALAAGIPDPAPAAPADNQGQQPASNASDMEAFIKQQSDRFDKIASNAEASVETINRLAASEQQRLINEAVDSAVEFINDGVDGDPRLADTFLNSMYRNDPNFQKVFDNRESNPEAWEKAKGIAKTEWQGMNQKSIDPQVAENQRAVKESQTTGTTYQAQDTDTRLSNMSDAEFMQEARNMIRSG